MIIEQVLGRDGTLNTHATFLLTTSQGDRIPITLPPNAELMAVLLNGQETPVEAGTSPDVRIVRLPPSAGQISRFVIEISYGLQDASASNLIAPSLPKEIPIQRSLWRLWIPEDYYLLGFDRVFSQLGSGRSHETVNMLGRNQPSQVAFKLPAQGKALDFTRLGAPGKLSVKVVRKGIFSVVIWVLIIAGGILMLKLNGFHRILVILAAGFVGGMVHLYMPLLVRRTAEAGIFAGILVILLWMAQWRFLKLPMVRSQLPAKQKVKAQQETPEEAEQPKQDKE